MIDEKKCIVFITNKNDHSCKIDEKHVIFLERSAVIFTERLAKQEPLQPWKPGYLILHCNESFFNKYGLHIQHIHSKNFQDYPEW